MKSAGILGPANISFAAGQTFYEASAAKKSRGGQENADHITGSAIPGTASLSAREPTFHDSQSNIQGGTGAALLDVPYISQLGQYPTGCESVSTVMALQYLGIEITVDEFIDNYLDLGTEPWTAENGEMYGGDPWETFLGDPREASGWGCYAPVIKKAIDRAVDSESYQVSSLFGIPLETLCETYVDQNIPVILWASMEMKGVHPGKQWVIRETGETFTWKAGEHCLLLVGYDDLYYYFNDPRKNSGTVRYPKELVETCYGEMGKQAVVVRKEESETWWEEKLMQ